MIIKKLSMLGAAGALAVVLVACGSSTTASTSSTSSSPATSSSAMSSSAMGSSAMGSSAMGSSAMGSSAMGSSAMGSSAMGSSSAMATTGASASGLVGPGCAAYAKANPTGAGSVEGMSQASLTAAASGNPLLKTLVAAVSGKLNPKVNLLTTLDSAEFTVFAPVDSAFAKVPAATLATLKTDSATLTKILTYHVVAGQIAPDKIAGSHKTVEGGTVTVTGSGDNLKVGNASVICGGVKTKNATVYLIDSVLSPTA